MSERIDIDEIGKVSKSLDTDEAGVAVTVFNLDTSSAVALNTDPGVATEYPAGSGTWNWTFDWVTRPDRTTNYLILMEGATYGQLRKYYFTWYEDNDKYKGVVYLDLTGGGTAGTGRYVGTDFRPSSNLADAKTIATRLNTKIIIVKGALTLNSNVDNYEFRAWRGFWLDSIAFANQSVINCKFINLTLTGQQNGTDVFFDQCYMVDCTDVQGWMTNATTIVNSLSKKVGADLKGDNVKALPISGATVPIDLQNGAGKFAFGSFSGLIEFTNVNSALAIIYIAGIAIDVVLGATVLKGAFVFSGTGDQTGATGRVMINVGEFTKMSTTMGVPDGELTIINKLIPGSIAEIYASNHQVAGTLGKELDAIFDKLPTNYIMGSPDAADKLTIIPIINIPYAVDLANTATVRMGMIFTTNRGAVPTTGEIAPGDITIDRKAKGGTSWVSVISTAMSESSGRVYYDALFNSALGYAEGDTIRVSMSGVSVVINSVTYQVCTPGIYYYFHIRETGVKEMYAKLPTNYIMGSSVVADKDDEIDTLVTRVGTPVALDSGSADLAGMLKKMADDNGGADFNAEFDSLNKIRTNTPADVWGYGTRTLSAFGFSVTVGDKTGFSLSATGADLILKSSTFIQAIVAAINEFATYGLTALNTLLVTTGIKAASIPAATLADDAITASKFDESTAFPIKSADIGTTTLARTGADADTLETLSDQIDLISTSDITAIKTRLEAIYQIEKGCWKLIGSPTYELWFYIAGTPDIILLKFKCYDISDNPSITNIAKVTMSYSNPVYFP